MSDIEQVVRSFQDMLESDDPILLQKLGIEIQLEDMRRAAYDRQQTAAKMSRMVEILETMDWKLWETLKTTNPKFDGDQ